MKIYILPRNSITLSFLCKRCSSACLLSIFTSAHFIPFLHALFQWNIRLLQSEPSTWSTTRPARTPTCKSGMSPCWNWATTSGIWTGPSSCASGRHWTGQNQMSPTERTCVCVAQRLEPTEFLSWVYLFCRYSISGKSLGWRFEVCSAFLFIHTSYKLWSFPIL